MYLKLRRWILVVVLAAIGGLAYAFWKRDFETPTDLKVVAAADPLPARQAAAPAAETPADAASASPAPVNADDVTRWIAEATGGDAARRAAAITALAQVPASQALPVLRRVLMNGEPAVDRPLALQSLRDLALNRGDPESSIRNAIREAIYHGDDQTMAGDAQEALDVIDEGLAK
jgi:hypothetical protein